jgi:hypothetical protein
VDERRHRWSREIKKEKNMATKEGGEGEKWSLYAKGKMGGRREQNLSLLPWKEPHKGDGGASLRMWKNQRKRGTSLKRVT